MTYQEKLVPRNDAVLISTHLLQKYVRSLTRRRKNITTKHEEVINLIGLSAYFLLFIECECFPRSIRMTKTTATFFLLPGGPALKTKIHKTVIPFVFVSLLVFPLIRQRQGRDGVCLLPAPVQLVQAPLVAGRGKLQGGLSVTLNINLIDITFVSLFPSFHSDIQMFPMLHVP